jgi:hypothetical protein
MASSDHQGMGLIRRASLVAAGLVLLTASPAFAHALNGASPSNYRTRILAVEPPRPGIDVEVVEAGNRILLTNRTQDEVVVLGYVKEPYLRIGPQGVFENLRSGATYTNRSRLPTAEVPAKASRDPNTPPEWRKVSAGNSFRWHDHRVHYMGLQPPGPVKADPGQEHVIIPAWEVPLLVGPGQEEILVKGDLTWVPGPSNLPWLGLAALSGLALVGLVLGPGARRPSLARGALMVALAVLVALDVSRLAGLAGNVGSSLIRAAGQNLPAVAAWVVAVLAAVFILRGDARVGPALAAGTGALFALSAFGDINVLSRSQLATNAPVWLIRMSVATGFGLGLGLLVVAFVPLLSPPAPVPVAAPAEPPSQPVGAE